MISSTSSRLLACDEKQAGVAPANESVVTIPIPLFKLFTYSLIVSKFSFLCFEISPLLTF